VAACLRSLAYYQKAKVDQEIDFSIHQLDPSYASDLHANFHKFLASIPELSDKTEFFLQGDYSLEKIASALCYPRIIVLGCLVQRKLVGFLWGSASYAGLGFISWLWVNDSYRSRGIAKKLVETYESYVLRESGHVVELYCFSNMEAFYTKLGYKIIGKREKGYFKLPQSIMEKLLT